MRPSGSIKVAINWSRLLLRNVWKFWLPENAHVPLHLGNFWPENWGGSYLHMARFRIFITLRPENYSGFIGWSCKMPNNVWQLMCFFPKQCGNTWGSYGSSKRPGWLDRGGGRAVCGIHRYFRGFVPVCSFRLWIFVVSGWPRPTGAGLVCKFS